MAKQKKATGFFDKLKDKYRLSIYRDASYEEVLNFKLTRLNVFVISGVALFLFITIVASIIAYTPLREFIPGYPDENTLRDIVTNAQELDSLELELERRDRYFDNMKKIISGEEPDNYENKEDTNVEYKEITFERSSEDSLIRELFQDDNNYDLSVFARRGKIKSISQLHFFPPVTGIVTKGFKADENHYGTDIVTASADAVKSTLNGTVTMATWTLETGWVVQVQHNNNLISVYKHNSEILKHVGDYVKAGDPIAVIGNSGELTTGPHLHFELWYNGVALNPEDYVSF